MTGFLATPADENEFAGRLVPSEPAPFLRLRRFNELAVFSEEKKNGALFIGSRVTPRINDANNTLAGLKPSFIHLPAKSVAHASSPSSRKPLR
jgi:hypothetical protein